MNDKTVKMIRKYARLRGKNEVALNEKLLKRVYENASLENQKLYRTEMEDYFKAIDQKLIKPGDSYLYSILQVIEQETNGKSKPTAEADS